MSTQSVILCPRPYARFAGRLLLLPLLPERKPLKLLPSEIWMEVFKFVLHHQGSAALARSLLMVSKAFKDIALPLVYCHIQISCFAVLQKFHARLHIADQKWDSIRRITYSTPGRWVQVLDFSNLSFTNQTQALELDSLLTSLFPLLPFLARLSLNPSVVLSRRAITSLAEREGSKYIYALEGLNYIFSQSSMQHDPLLRLLRCCINIEELEIIGLGPDPAEMHVTTGSTEFSLPNSFKPFELQKLHTMSLLSMHFSPLLLALLHTPLPSLRKLTITPYDDVPYPISLVSKFISVHGEALRSLLLFVPKSWPSKLHPSPTTLLHTSPNLRHLSLENPLPILTYSGIHPLQILSIPRPNAEFWTTFEELLPHLPQLYILRTRDVRWLRKGMTSRAQETGVQGEMREWRRRLVRKGIRVLDSNWEEND